MGLFDIFKARNKLKNCVYKCTKCGHEFVVNEWKRDKMEQVYCPKCDQLAAVKADQRLDHMNK